ncbi:MAG TPA: RNA-binding S4 domain-containing protein [Tissierellales bacterium]|nr:RNA-binding S4 domain-containing protein [Tissierellales bacterium]
MKKIKIETEYIKLDQFLKYIGVVETGGEGKIIIKNGNIKVNGKIATERGKKVRKDDKIEILGIGEYIVI